MFPPDHILKKKIYFVVEKNIEVWDNKDLRKN